MQWFEGQVVDSKRPLPFFYRKVLHCGRYLLRQIAYQDSLVHVPRREFDRNTERMYAEMHTANVWWDVQGQRPNLLYRNVSRLIIEDTSTWCNCSSHYSKVRLDPSQPVLR